MKIVQSKQAEKMGHMSGGDNKQFIHPWELHEMLEWLQGKIEQDGFQPHAIIGIGRGGLYPAVVLSHKLKIPMTAVFFSHPQGKGSQKSVNDLGLLVRLPVTLYEDRLLVVDDLVDSGKTMDHVCNYYTGLGYKVRSAVIVRKAGSKYQPHFYASDAVADRWIVFPWEM